MLYIVSMEFCDMAETYRNTNRNYLEPYRNNKKKGYWKYHAFGFYDKNVDNI